MDIKHLIVLPGWGHNRFTYRAFVNAAPTDWQADVVDYNKLFKSHHRQEFGSLVAHQLLQTEQPFYLLGHSTGGALAIDFALYHPSAIKRLFLIDSEGIVSPEHAIKAVLKTLHSKSYGKRHYVHKLQSVWWMTKRPRLHYHLGRHGINADLESELPKLTVPTTIFWGDKDVGTPLWQGEKMHELIQQSIFHVLPDKAHSWIIYSPQEFWNIVKSDH